MIILGETAFILGMQASDQVLIILSGKRDYNAIGADYVKCNRVAGTEHAKQIMYELVNGIRAVIKAKNKQDVRMNQKIVCLNIWLRNCIALNIKIC